MAVNFPNSPNQNDTHTVSGVTYKWDGTSWLAQGVTGLYTLPTASDTTLGGVKVGRNLDISTSVLSVSEPLAFDQTVGTSTTPIVLSVRRAAKTTSNKYYGLGSGNCFYINDLEAPPLNLVVGKTYRFDQSDASNAGHILKFYGRETKLSATNNTNEYEYDMWIGRDLINKPSPVNGVDFGTFAVYVGTPGTAGAYTEITPHERGYGCFYYQSADTSSAYEGGIANKYGGQGNEHPEYQAFYGQVDFTNIIYAGDGILNYGCNIFPVNANTYSKVTIDVKVKDKSTKNQFNGQGSTKCYELAVHNSDHGEDQWFQEAPHLQFSPGRRYKFDLSDSSCAGFSLRFYKDKDKNEQYITGWSGNSGTPGSAGAYSEILIGLDTPGMLYYMADEADLVGGSINCQTAVGGGGGGGTPGGNTTEFQYNNGGAFAGSSLLTLTSSNLQLNGGSANAWWDGGINSFNFRDNAKATFGDEPDMEVWHDPSVGNLISSTTAGVALNVTADTFKVRNHAKNADFITADTNGVSLLSGGSAKLTTSTTGVSVSGTFVASGLTYPAADGTNGTFLQTDGSGNLSWQAAGGGGGATAIDALTDVDTTTNAPANGQVLKWNGSNWTPQDDNVAGSGSGLSSRSTSSAATSASHADGSAENVTIGSVAKTYSLLRIQTSHACWVTLYTDTTSRTNDASRNETTDPLPGNGVIAEVITTDGAGQIITPAVIGFNFDPTPSDNVYAKVVNKSGATRPITVTITFVKLEA